MKLKERLEKINTYIYIEEKIKKQIEETEKLDKAISDEKALLESLKIKSRKLDGEISDKKALLESLRIEAVKLKDFINESFGKDFSECDYTVDIRYCYIVAINNKKYICSRIHKVHKSDWYTVATGRCIVETYEYYDVLNVKNNKYQYLHSYTYTHSENNSSYISPEFDGEKPDYEEHILNLYPELCNFTNDQVPNTYLKKIYYEINDLGHKQLNKQYFNK